MPGSTDSAKERVKRIPLRFLVLAPLIVACVLIARSHVIAVGGRYEMVIDDFPGVALTTESFSFEPPDMMRVVSVEQPAPTAVERVIDMVPDVVDKVGTVVSKKKAEKEAENQVEVTIVEE